MVNPISQNGPGGWVTREPQFNLGDLVSDPELRAAVHALPAKEIGYAHLILKDFAQAVNSKDYAQAQEIYKTIQTSYGTVTPALLEVLQDNLNPGVISQIT